MASADFRHGTNRKVLSIFLQVASVVSPVAVTCGFLRSHLYRKKIDQIILVGGVTFS